MTAEQLLFQFAETTTYSADQFLVAECNREAHRWTGSVTDWPSHALVLTGPPRSGKTHLAHIWAAATGAQIIRAARLSADTVPQFAGGHLAVEGADGIADERTLFHLYNLIRENGRRLLLTARVPPAGWGMDLPDLASRINATPAVAVRELSDDLMGPLLLKLAGDRQLAMEPRVIQYLLSHLERSFAACDRAIAALDRAGLLHKKRITVALAREVIAANR